MGIKVCVLGSGSSGNCTLIQTAQVQILIDAGLSGRETTRRLALLGLRGEDIDGILVGHEHGDHIRGLDLLARKFGCLIFMNRATAEAVTARASGPWDIRIFSGGQAWSMGDLIIEPFSVLHDAQDPVGFSIRHGETKVVAVTDLGMATTLVKANLKGARVIIVEANHDRSLLLNGDRPWGLKQRIKSSQGHLSNEAAADLLAEETDCSLSDVFLAHLSQDCNRPELAVGIVKERLRKSGKGHVRVRLTYPDRVSEVVEAVGENSGPVVPETSGMIQLPLPGLQ